jgi:hypothetical protein
LQVTSSYDVKALLPVRWKRRLAVGAEHLVHMDERALALVSLMSSQPSTPGILHHGVPATTESQLIEISCEMLTDEAEIHVKVIHDFVARTPSGRLVFGLRSSLVPEEHLICRIPVQPESSTDKNWKDGFILLLKQHERSPDPDLDRPDGAHTISLSGVLGSEIEVAYPGLATPIVKRPGNLSESITTLTDCVAVGFIKVIGRKVHLDHEWSPATTSLDLGSRVYRNSFADFSRKLENLRTQVSKIPSDFPPDVGASLRQAERSRHELAGILRGISVLGPLKTLSPEMVWNGILVPLQAWVQDHGQADDNDRFSSNMKEAPAWGLVGTSDILDKGSKLVEYLINRRPWL